MFHKLALCMDVSVHSTHSDTETAELGKTFAERLALGDVVALYGDLGSGKTEFVRGICEYFAVSEIVSSPTFTIINQYSGALPEHDEEEIKIYHLDLYRINSKRELEDIGFSECTNSSDSIKLIEWANKANGTLPKRHYSVIFRFLPDDDEARSIEIRRVEETDVEDDIVVSAQA